MYLNLACGGEMSKEESNRQYYEKAYEKGYGIMFPESHVIRWYERVLKYELKIDGSNGQKLLDFGCGNGTHAMFFSSKGFETYGVDIDERAISKAKERMSDNSGHFYSMSPLEDISRVFNTKFDIFFSNQVLYYFSNDNLKKILEMFKSMLNENAIVFITMISKKNYLYEHVVETGDDGLSLIRLDGRIKGESYLNFTNDTVELNKKLSIFEPLFIGDYDCSFMEGDSRHHFIFTGRLR